MEKLLLELLNQNFKVTEQKIGDFKEIKKNGMHFQVRSFEVENLGHFCIMDMKGMLGLMKMQTAVLTPFSVQAPLISYDGIQVLKNETVITEFYDTLTGSWEGRDFQMLKQRFAVIPDQVQNEHWYDGLLLPETVHKKAKGMSREFSEMQKAYAGAIVQSLKQALPCDEEEKREKTALYVEQLLTHGGPAVNQFKKMLGEDKTNFFLHKIMFGTETM